MADRSTYGQEGYPIPHTNFRGAIDSNYINPNLVPVDILKECTNLTPFRRSGSLQQCPGHTTHLTSTQLPTVTGFKLVDFYVFSVDKDSQEITLLVYEDSPHTRTRIFISPWYNPSFNMTNYDSNYTAETWVGTSSVPVWLELTERYYGTISTVSTTNPYNITLTGAKGTGSMRGWFLVNTSLPESSRFKKYNMILENTLNAGVETLTMFSDCSTYNVGDSYIIVRFPVNYLYNTEVNNGGRISDNEFDPTITHFECFGNELRMACGKDRRPLILQMIDNRKYFNEQVSLSYISSIYDLFGGAYYYNTTLITSFFGNTPVPVFSETPTVPATATSTLGVSLVDKLSGTFTDGDIVIEADSSLDSIRIRGFRLLYVGGTDTFTVLDAGEYTKCLPYQLQPAASYVPFTVVSLDDDSPVSGTIAVERMKIVNVIITTTGSGYSSAGTVTFSAASTFPTVEVEAASARYSIASSPFDLQFNGLWFDFEQPPQELYDSQISAFGKRILVAGTETKYFASDGVWYNTEPATMDYVKFTIKSGGNFAIFQGTTYINGTYLMRLDNSAAKLSINPTRHETSSSIWSKVMSYSWFTDLFSVSYRMNNYTQYTSSASSNNLFTRVGGLTGNEAGGNATSYNKFISMEVTVPQLPTIVVGHKDHWDNVKRYAFIITAQIDRNESVISHGFWRPGDDTNAEATLNLDSMRGMTISFGSWFSRRLKGINLYNQEVDTILESTRPFESKVDRKLDSYPYFRYFNNIFPSTDSLRRSMDINEIPHFSSYSIEDFKKQIDSNYLSPYNQDLHNIDENTYHIDRSSGKFYIKMWDDDADSKVGVTTSGLGLKFIVKCNRYIDQDITMNYTKSAFVGQTNGRRFLVGCKNMTETPVLENGDMIYPNNYAIGVSQYDTFLRDANIISNVGDTDIVRDIINYRGYLVIVKDTNIYALDVNTDDELKYRVVDTMVGRGSKFSTGNCVTPNGIVVPTSDGVWLMNPSGIAPLLSSQNGRLNLWKSIFSYPTLTINSVYYNKYNELMIFMNTESEGDGYTYVFVYNFTYSFWTNYSYSNSFIKRVRTNSEHEVLMLNTRTDVVSNVSHYHSNIVKVDEDSSQFIQPDNTYYNVVWTIKTHNMPYGTRLKNILSAWITFEMGYKTGNSSTYPIVLTPFYNEVQGTPLTVSVDKATTYIESIMKDEMRVLNAYSDSKGLTSFGFSLSSGTTRFYNFNLNSFYLWITTQNRVPQL